MPPSSSTVDRHARPASGDATPLRRPDQLVRVLLEDIAKGVWPPGSRLPNEAALCVRYEVSRTVLREAIARLKADGIVDTQQGRGSFVLQHSLRKPFRFDPALAHSPQGIAQLAELRLGVEGMAAALAAERRTAAQLAHLRQCLARMEQAARTGSGGSEADLAFHQTIAEATGNGFYKTFMDYLRRFYAVAIETARANSARMAGLSAKAQEEHVAIYEAIAAQSPSRAEAATKRHIRNAVRRLQAMQASEPGNEPAATPRRRS